jgi:hypothetical protein
MHVDVLAKEAYHEYQLIYFNANVFLVTAFLKHTEQVLSIKLPSLKEYFDELKQMIKTFFLDASQRLLVEYACSRIPPIGTATVSTRVLCELRVNHHSIQLKELLVVMSDKHVEHEYRVR